MATQRPKNKAPLEGNPRVRLGLIRELAQALQPSALARKYEVTPAAIAQFAKRHEDEIAAAREDLTNAFHGNWLADKEARVAEYLRDIELMNTLIEELVTARTVELVRLRGTQDDDATHELVEVQDVTPAVARALRAKHRALHQAAEELGQLPSRVQVNIGGRRVEHIIKGVDISQV